MTAIVPYTAQRAFTAAEERHIRFAEREAGRTIRRIYERGAEMAAQATSLEEAGALVMTGLTDAVQREGLASMLRRIHQRVQAAYAEEAYQQLRRERGGLRRRGDWTGVIEQWLAEHAGELITEMAGTSRREIIAALRRVAPPILREEGSISDVVRALRQEIPQLSRVRAVRIARTEVLTAENIGQLRGAERAAEDFGLTMQKKWLATSGGRTRETHRAAGQQDSVPLDGSFTVGGYACKHPCDPALPAHERINCRCTMTFEVVDDAGRVLWRLRCG